MLNRLDLSTKMGMKMNQETLDSINSLPGFEDYIECALWSSSDDEGDNFDYYSVDDFDEKSLLKLANEYRDFLDMANGLIGESGLDMGQVGHDFWLTRNGHGAGFWDRGLGQIGRDLTKAAKSFGTQDLYINDGVIYA